MKRNYAFLLSKSWTSDTFIAHNLKQAWRMAKKWYANQSQERQEMLGELRSMYLVCSLKQCVMRGWFSARNLK